MNFIPNAIRSNDNISVDAYDHVNFELIEFDDNTLSGRFDDGPGGYDAISRWTYKIDFDGLKSKLYNYSGFTIDDTNPDFWYGYVHTSPSTIEEREHNKYFIYIYTYNGNISTSFDIKITLNFEDVPKFKAFISFCQRVTFYDGEKNRGLISLDQTDVEIGGKTIREITSDIYSAPEIIVNTKNNNQYNFCYFMTHDKSIMWSTDNNLYNMLSAKGYIDKYNDWPNSSIANVEQFTIYAVYTLNATNKLIRYNTWPDDTFKLVYKDGTSKQLILHDTTHYNEDTL